MERKEFSAKLDVFQQRRYEILQRVAGAARNLIPILKDHNLSNTAGELDRLLFEYDALEQEMTKLIEADPRAFIEALTDSLKRQ